MVSPTLKKVLNISFGYAVTLLVLTEITMEIGDARYNYRFYSDATLNGHPYKFDISTENVQNTFDEICQIMTVFEESVELKLYPPCYSDESMEYYGGKELEFLFYFVFAPIIFTFFILSLGEVFSAFSCVEKYVCYEIPKLLTDVFLLCVYLLIKFTMIYSVIRYRIIIQTIITALLFSVETSKFYSDNKEKMQTKISNIKKLCKE